MGTCSCSSSSSSSRSRRRRRSSSSSSRRRRSSSSSRRSRSSSSSSSSNSTSSSSRSSSCCRSSSCSGRSTGSTGSVSVRAVVGVVGVVLAVVAVVVVVKLGRRCSFDRRFSIFELVAEGAVFGEDEVMLERDFSRQVQSAVKLECYSPWQGQHLDEILGDGLGAGYGVFKRECGGLREK